MSESLLTPVGAENTHATTWRGRHNRMNAIEALERGFALFQSTFSGEAWRYYAGAAPLVTCFILLWVIDGQIQLSDTTVLGEAVLLAAAYVVHALTSVRYMQGVRERAFGVPRPKRQRPWMQAAALGRLLTWKIVLAFATLATLLSVAGGPLFYSACQFASLEAQEDTLERHSLVGCLSLAVKWYDASFLLFLMLFPLWGAAWLNGLIMAAALPGLLHSIFGVNTLLSTESGIQSLLQSWAFWLGLFAGVWLALDPIIKCTYVVVYQHLRSRSEGDDLRSLLSGLPHEEEEKAARISLSGSRQPFAAALVVLMTLMLGAPRAARAQTAQLSRGASAPSAEDAPAPLSVQDLRRAIDEESQRAAYRWHDAEHPSPPTWLDKFFDKVKNATRRAWRTFSDFLRSFLPKDFNLTPSKGNSKGWRVKDLRVWIGLVLVVSIGVGAFLIWRRRQVSAAALSVPVATAPLPDLSDTAIATEHSEDQWFTLANGLEKEGELRLALRAAYLGLLAGLAQREWLTIRRDRTNREYLDEFMRRWRRRPKAAVEARAEIPEILRGSLRLFDRVWYGSYALTPEAVAAYRQAQRELLNHV